MAGLLVACGGTTEHSPGALKPGGDEPRPVSEASDESCPVAGVWEGRVPGGSFAGESIRIELENADGAVRGIAGPSPVNQSWSLYGNILSVQDRSRTHYTGPCAPEQSATYQIDFDPSCTEMRIIALDDACEERRRTMDWLVLTLQ